MLRARSSFVLAAAMISATLAFGAASATAGTYCVGANPNCPIGVTPTAATATNLQSALFSADNSSGPDTIWVGPGTFDLGDLSPSALGVNELDDRIDIHGSGRGQTILMRNGGPATLVRLTAPPAEGSVLTDLTVRATGALTGNGSNVLDVSGFSVERVDVEFSADSSLTDTAAVNLNPGNLRDSSVSTNMGVAVRTGSTGVNEISESSLTGMAPNGIIGVSSGVGSALNYWRNVSKGFSQIHLFDSSNDASVKDSLFDLGSRLNSTAIYVWSDGLVERSLTADRISIVGSGVTQAGMNLNLGDTGPEDLTVKLKNSIVALSDPGSIVMSCVPDVSSGTLLTVLTNTAADQSSGRYLDSDPSCSTTKSAPSFDTASTPVGFVSPTTGDYSLRWDSPFIDTANTGTPTTDLAGNPRFVVGKAPFTAPQANGDPGAYEYQASVPSGQIVAGPSAEGQPTTFTATGSDADPGETAQLTYAWNFGDGASASGASAAHVYARNGIYNVALTTTDPAGRSSVANQTLVVPEPVATVRVTKKPRRAVKRSRSSFKVSKRGQIKLSFAKSAKMRLTLETYNKRATRSKRYKRVRGSQTLSVKTSSLYLAIGGRFNHRTLRTGSYRLTVTPLAPSGNAGRATRVSFKLRR